MRRQRRLLSFLPGLLGTAQRLAQGSIFGGQAVYFLNKLTLFLAQAGDFSLLARSFTRQAGELTL